ncbi:MAG: phosphoribosylglycinamide formyltransferase [Candidatus Dormibacteraeota bacterium]|nr:phosphoribosylglycinamide formyltransferase [Candidatus Dormibacteraeota bacterium]
MSVSTRVAILASGSGSNLTALLDAAQTPAFPAQIVLVVSNRRQCGALDIARARGIPAMSLPVKEYGGDAAARDRAILDTLRNAGAELIVCAGYDRVLSDDVVAAYPDAILNIHPSLLPAFGGGMDAVEQALAAGVKVTGCTVHLLKAGAVDAGPIVLQAAVAVEEDDDADTLRARIHEQEWRVLPEAVALWSTGRLQVNGSKVRILAKPRQREGAR